MATLYWNSSSSTDPLAANWKPSTGGANTTLASGDVAVLAPVTGTTLVAINSQTQQAVTLEALYVEEGFTPAVGSQTADWQISFNKLFVRQETLASGRVRLNGGATAFKAYITGTGTVPTDASQKVVRLTGSSTLNELYVTGASDVGFASSTPGESGALSKCFVSGANASVLLGSAATWTELRNNGAELEVRGVSSGGLVTTIAGTTTLRGDGTNGTLVALGGTTLVASRPPSSTLNAVDYVVLEGGDVDVSINPADLIVGKLEDRGGNLILGSPSQLSISTTTLVFDTNVRRTSTYSRS